jgi:hypothetical protein
MTSLPSSVTAEDVPLPVLCPSDFPPNADRSDKMTTTRMSTPAAPRKIKRRISKERASLCLFGALLFIVKLPFINEITA